MLNIFKGALIATLLLLSAVSHAESLMNLVDIRGIRSNDIVGYGLVVGLDGTGDKSQVKFTSQSVANMIKQFGVHLDDSANPKIKNVAAVSVTATIGPMLGEGQKINVIVSSLGDATSLRGGTLLLTPLYSMDGEVYAVAQGNVTVGGLSAEGEDGSSITVNIPTVGRIPNGAVLEKAVPNTFNESRIVTLNLRKPNFTTAKNIASSINDVFGKGVAEPINLASVEVTAPMGRTQRVTFMSMLDEIEVEQGKDKARLIFNSRTGTVVISKAVRISEVAVSHAGITISVQEDSQISQPNGLSEQGVTERLNDSEINLNKGDSTMMVWPEGVDLRTIVNAVNQLGASVDDLMQILQALDAAGALNAELIVI